MRAFHSLTRAPFFSSRTFRLLAETPDGEDGFSARHSSVHHCHNHHQRAGGEARGHGSANRHDKADNGGEGDGDVACREKGVRGSIQVFRAGSEPSSLQGNEREEAREGQASARGVCPYTLLYFFLLLLAAGKSLAR